MLVHELGRLLVARFCGMRVKALSVGVGPQLVGIRSRDTDWSPRWLPLAAFVRIPGLGWPRRGGADGPPAPGPKTAIEDGHPRRP
jgi:membrane-associated protease RseP (regulator of RpoE activity)